MRDNSLKLTLEQAKQYYKTSNDEGFKQLLEDNYGKVHFKKLKGSIMDRCKTFEDILEEAGETLDSFTEKYISSKDSKDEIAFKKLKLITQVLNEGEGLDWSNNNQRKYFPYFRMGDSSGVGFAYNGYCNDLYSISDVASRLCFKNVELAEFAGKQFLDIYKDYMTNQ